MRTVLVVAAIVSAAAVSGCGQSPEPGIASAGGATSSAAPAAPAQPDGLRFARCMRENGVDMPDPEPGSDAVTLRGEVDKDSLDRASRACEKYGPAGQKKRAAADPAVQNALLKYARCMRENGIDMKDPDFSDGRVRLGGNRMNLNSPETEKAMEICREHLPGSGKRP
ncbi:hypothetical protein [Streptosporangium sp. NPDC003464]